MPNTEGKSSLCSCLIVVALQLENKPAPASVCWPRPWLLGCSCIMGPWQGIEGEQIKELVSLKPCPCSLGELGSQQVASKGTEPYGRFL